MNVATPTTIKPGTASGITTFRRIYMRDAPSIQADSSSSIGIFSRYDFSSQIPVGTKNAAPGTNMAAYVLSNPIERSNL